MFKFISNLFKEEIKKPDNKGILCDCTGDIYYQKTIECEGFPLKGGFHTSFIIGTCKKCNGFTAFPSYNLKLAIRECSDNGRSILTDLGLVLDKITDR